MQIYRWSRGFFLFALLAAVSASAIADSPECLVSFDSAKLNVCNERVSLANKNLRHLADVRAFADSGIRIVKFDGPITSAQRSALAALNVEILGYAPFYGYKVRMDASQDNAVRGIPGVNWTGPYLPVWKVSVNLANELGGGRILEQATELDSLWVSLHPGVSRSQARSSLESIPGLEFRFGGDGPDHEFMVMRFQRAQLSAIVDQLAMNEDVNAINFHWPNQLENSQGAWLHQSGENTPSELVPIFDQGIFGCGQVASALDSGLHTSHCSFEDTVFGAPVSDACDDGAGCAPITPDFGHRKVGAHYQWRDGSSAPGDEHGHGTFVSGNMVGNNHADAVDCDTLTTPGGITDLDGMAPGAKMIIQEAGPGLEYLNDHGGTLYHAATLAHGNGAYIHNNSWGSSCRNFIGACIADCEIEYRASSRNGDMAAWENPELLIVTSAGNSGGGDGGPGCGPGADVGAPGNAKNVFSIAANNRGAGGNNMADFSSRGPTIDRRTKPDVTAQGAALQSAEVSACGTTGNSGTSFSSPTVAGLSALVREYLQRGFYPLGFEEPSAAISNPTAALIKAIMINGSVEIDGTGTSGDFPDVNQGWGRVLLDNSLYFDGDDRRLWLHDETTGLQTGDVGVHQVTADTGEPLTVTLVWHDYPAEENANPAIVNMLRLEVEDPNGDVWTQKLTPGGGLADPNPFQDTTLTDYDDRNTVHQITFDAPATGTYDVRVRAIQVAQGDDQPYALAATGNLLGVGEPDFVLQADPVEAEVCQATDAVYDIGVLGVIDFDDPVTLTIDDVPAGASSGFSVNPVTPADPAAVSVLTIGDTNAVTPGEYTLVLTGDSSGPSFDPATHSMDLGLRVDESLSAPGLLTPADTSTDVDLQPEFTWGALAGAVEYQIQVSTDAGFGTLVIDEFVTDATFTPDTELASGTDHFWRVRAQNACGDSDWSAEWTFQTRFEPVPDVSPASFEFMLEPDQADSDTLTIENIGTGDLVWSIDVAEGGARGTSLVYLEEDFEGSFPPAGWTVTDDGADSCLWQTSDDYEMSGWPGTDERGAAVDADDCFSGSGAEADTSLITPSLDLSTAVDAELTFDLAYREEFIDSLLELDVSVDGGGSWTTLESWNENFAYPDDVALPVTVDLSDYDGEADVTLRWRWTSDWDWWAFVDNVVVNSPIGALCADPAVDSWLSATPDAGTTTGGDSSDVTVEVDSTGLADGSHFGVLCVETNDPENELIVVPVNLEVGGPPVADISPASFDFTVPQDGSDDDVLNIGNTGDLDLVWSIEEAEPAGVRGSGTVLLDEDFEGSFPPADWSVVDDDGGGCDWQTTDDYPMGADGFGDNPWLGIGQGLLGAAVDSDDCGSGTTADTSLITPSLDFSGQTDVTLDFDLAINALSATIVSVEASTDGGVMWTEVESWADENFAHPDEAFGPVTIDLSAYDGEPDVMLRWRYQSGWDWWVYVDNVMVTADGGGGGTGCNSPTDVPWLSVSPVSGATPGGDSVPATVSVDTTGMALGDYDALLCVTTNDTGNALVEVPVSLTVEESIVPPTIDVDPTSFSVTLPADGTGDEDLVISNLGEETLNWTIDTAEPASEGVRYASGKIGVTDFSPPVSYDRSAGETPAGRQGDGVVSPVPQGGPIAGDWSEGFDDITTLPGSGWAMQNNSDPLGASDWFQGNPDSFPAHEGSPTAYIGANFESTAGAGTISNWLLTPEIELQNGTEVTFWTRTSEQFETFYDRLEVRLSTAGSSTDVGTGATDVGDFGELLLTINEDLEPVVYPEVWTEFTVTISGLGAPTTGRVAFRYFVTDGGPDGTNSDYIGIDTVSVTQPTGGGGDCDNPTTIPWLSASPDSGATDGGDSDTVAVNFDADGLAPGDYDALLCVESDDPVDPLVEVPVALTVEGDLPVADITPESFSFEVANDTAAADVLNMGNTGDGDLTWSIEEAESAAGADRGGDIVEFNDINFVPNQDFTGGAVQWSTGDTCDCDTEPYDLNLYAVGDVDLAFFWPFNATQDAGGVSLDGGTTYAVLEPGDTIGPGSEFLLSAQAVATANWRQAGDVDGYLGFRFENPGTGDTNYGYAHITTTGATGYPVTVVGWAYNQVGDPITIPDGSASACDSPTDIPWLSVDNDNGTTPPMDSVPVDVQVDSTGLTPGDYDALLCVTTNDPASELVEVPVMLTVLDQAPAELAVDPDTLDFGDVPVDSMSTLSFDVSNDAAAGAADLALSAITVGGDAEFVVTGGDCEAGVTSLAPGDGCMVEVTFAPGAVAAYSGDVTVEGNGQSAMVALSGMGVDLGPGELELSPSDLAFGNVSVGDTETGDLTLTNTGVDTAAVLVSSILVSGTGGAFSDTGNGTCEAGVTELAPGDSCTIEVGFTPTDETSYAGSVVVDGADDKLATATLSGAGGDPDDDIFSDRFEE